jgi:hypothetical protein
MNKVTILLLFCTLGCVADRSQSVSATVAPETTSRTSTDIPCIMQGHFKGHGDQRRLKWHEGMTLKEAVESAGGIDEEKTYAIMVNGWKKGWVCSILRDDYKNNPELGSFLIQQTWSIWAVSKNCYEVFQKQIAEPRDTSNPNVPSAHGADGR